MGLKPFRSEGAPSYPRRSAAALDRTRRVLAALGVGAASVGLLGGCGATAAAGPAGGTAAVAPEPTGRPKQAARPAGRDRRVELCEATPRLSGDRRAANHFTCAPALSPSMPVHPGPPVITDGPLCPASPSWARFHIPRPMRTRLLLQGQRASLELIAPDGEVAARLGPQSECVTLDLEPGVWVLRATADPAGRASDGYFELWFEEARPGS